MIRNHSFFLIILVIFLGCSQKAESPEFQFDITEDTLGNILIQNRLNAPILLYISGLETPFKEIGAKDDFLINIPSDGSTPISLKIWKKSQVSDPSEPNMEKIYKHWDVVLPNTTSEIEQVTWLITSGNNSPDVGTLFFHYPSLDELGNMVIYEASIYLNDKSGNKIVTILPGDDNKTLGLDFGYYYLYYKYSYNYSNGSEVVGWIELDSLGIALNTLLNAGTPSQLLDVPIYYLSDIGRLGYIKIINESSSDLKIYTQNDIPLEEIVVTDQSTFGLSIIENYGGSYNYLLPQNNYSLTAKTLGTGEVISSRENVSVIELYNSSWTISDSISYRNITIINNISEPVTIHNELNNDYLGFYILAEDSMPCMIADSVTALVARNLNSTREAFQFDNNSSWNISKLNPNFYLRLNDSLNIEGTTLNSSEISLSWELGSSAENLTYQLLNADYPAYSNITYNDSLFKSITYKYLDDSKSEENYLFRINSNSSDGSSYGWQELSFKVDAIQSNGLYIYPRQQMIEEGMDFDFEIMLEEIENVRSVYIELEYDSEILSIITDAIEIGSVFSNCQESILLLNENPNQFGILKINISFLGESCNGFEGSGDLVSVKMAVSQILYSNESLIKINSNSSFRDLNNNEIIISNINSSEPHVARVVFP